MEILSDFVILIICSFAVYRLARLLPFERGPFKLFEKVRLFAGIKKNDTGRYWRIWDELAYFVRCPYCQGLWISILVSILIFYERSVLTVILYSFAMYGIQTFLQYHSELLQEE